MNYYYAIIAFLGLANAVGATVAYFQRRRQIKSSNHMKKQLVLAETRNQMAEARVRLQEKQIKLLTEILSELKKNI